MTNLRWSIIGLALVGVVAAFCAALLVASLRGNPADAVRGDAGHQTHILIATRSLRAMSVVHSEDVVVKTIEKNKAPKGYLSDPVQAIGKVLSFPVIEGQALTEPDVTDLGPGARLASTLPPGMRAVTVAPAGYSRLKGLLYPGCVVDVLCTFRMTGKNRQSVSKTLLENVRVLAVEGQTDSSSTKRSRNSRDSRQSSKGSAVTLMIKAKQAELLQVAIENGTISLAMRNPSDAKNTQARTLTRLNDIVGLLNPPGPMPEPKEGSNRVMNLFTEPIDQTSMLSEDYWKTTIIRGASFEVRSLPLPTQENY